MPLDALQLPQALPDRLGIAVDLLALAIGLSANTFSSWNGLQLKVLLLRLFRQNSAAVCKAAARR